MNNLYVHKSVKILSGTYEGLVGAVTQIDKEKKTVKVIFKGVFNGKEINAEKAFKFEQIEVM